MGNYQNDVVYYTRDLSIFKGLNHNRVQNTTRIKEIAQSMAEDGLMKIPIIVNKRKEVIDGQHRLEAARIAGKGLYYIQASNYGETQMMVINRTVKAWSQNDYLSHYVSKGVEDYIKLNTFSKSYPQFGLSDCMMLLTNAGHAPKRKVFNEGELKIKSYRKAEQWADFILSIGKYFPDGYTRTIFVRTMINILSKYQDEFNMEEFMKKADIRPDMFRICGDVPTYTRMVEDIYNYKRRTDGKIFIRV